MKKLIFSLLIALMSVFTVNAQLATENAKLFDNTYLTFNVGASTPLAFYEVLPLNPSAGLAFGKWFTPVFGVEGEGTFWFGSHVTNAFPTTTNRFDEMGTGHNFVRGSYGGVNGLVNFTNLFAGYKGTPRTFEVNGVFGSGWTHIYANRYSDVPNNGLGVKTGLDLAFNLGENKAHTVSVRPAVLWDVMDGKKIPLEFNRNRAQFYVGAAYTYHFNTSNSTHNFKVYDVGAMLAENDRLQHELQKKPKEVVIEKFIEKVIQVPVTNANEIANATTYVFFAQNSDVLTDEAKEMLDKVNGIVEITATASPEGTKDYNQKLSERRANVVREYLEAHGVKVVKAEGLGVTGKESARVAIVVVE